MDTPEPTPDPPAPPPEPTPRRRKLSRRTLLKLAGEAAALGVGWEAVRVLALTNVHTVVPGRVYRTAQLTPDELRAFIAKKGVRTIVNLRGVCSNMPWYLAECGVTHAANVNQEDVTLSAKRFPAPSELQRLIEVIDRSAPPLVFHCQRGADRTGLASVAARLLLTSDGLPAARRQLWPRYGHFAVGRTAVLDDFFDYYAAWLGDRGEDHAPERFRRWAREDYCPGPYRARLSLLTPASAPAGRGFTVKVRAENASVEPWHFTPGAAGGIRLRYSLTAPGGAIALRSHAGQFARTVRPGEAVELTCGVPPLPPGPYLFSADLIDAEPIDLLSTAFVQYGSEPLEAGFVLG